MNDIDEKNIQISDDEFENVIGGAGSDAPRCPQCGNPMMKYYRQRLTSYDWRCPKCKTIMK